MYLVSVTNIMSFYIEYNHVYFISNDEIVLLLKNKALLKILIFYSSQEVGVLISILGL